MLTVDCFALCGRLPCRKLIVGRKDLVSATYISLVESETARTICHISLLYRNKSGFQFFDVALSVVKGKVFNPSAPPHILRRNFFKAAGLSVFVVSSYTF